MKLRQILNNNTKKYKGEVFEDNNKIIVIKKDTNNYYDNSTDEKFEFKSITEYENWKEQQDWIFTTRKVNNFRKVGV